MIIKIIIFLIASILIISLLQFLIIIFPPKHVSKNNPETYNLKYEDISLTTDDKIIIKGWLIESKKANGTVIIGHGYPFDKGNILPVAKFLYPDYNLLFYDHRYFGESSGSISTVGIKEIKDVEAVVNFVYKRFPHKPIALYGFSLSASAMLMAQPNVNAIVADSAYADLEHMINRIYAVFGPLKYPFVKITELFTVIIFKVEPKKVSPAEAIKDSNIPTFIIHGEKDSQIPVENAYALKESNADIEFWIVKNADHGQAYTLVKDEYEQRIKSFLKKHMK